MISPILPTVTELQPQLDRLEANPGSVLLIAIEQPEICNFARTTWALLSKEERKSLKSALERARKKRALLREEGAGDLAAASKGKEQRRKGR